MLEHGRAGLPAEGRAVFTSDLISSQGLNGLEPHVPWQGTDPPREKGILFSAQRLPQLTRPWPVLVKRGFHFLIPTARLAPHE